MVVGFCFSFPIAQTALDHGKLIKWVRRLLRAPCAVPANACDAYFLRRWPELWTWLSCIRGSARCQGVGFAVGLLASASNLDFRIQKDSVSCSTMYFTLSLFCKHACFNLRVNAYAIDVSSFLFATAFLPYQGV